MLRTNDAVVFCTEFNTLLEMADCSHQGHDTARRDTSDVYRHFMLGNFTAEKTYHVFSSMALDQNHEQMNKIIKGDGGAVGLTENQSALLRWMTAGPEIARLINEFETDSLNLNNKHNEQTPANQVEFRSNVKQLAEVIKNMGNPFMNQSSDLYRLDTKYVMIRESVDSL